MHEMNAAQRKFTNGDVMTVDPLPFPTKNGQEKLEIIRPSWIQRRLYDLGVLNMENAPTQPPPGFFVNWTTITSIVVLVSAIAGLWFFTYTTASESGYQRGKDETERRVMSERLTKAEEEVRRTKDLRLVSAGQNAGHDEPTKK